MDKNTKRMLFTLAGIAGIYLAYEAYTKNQSASLPPPPVVPTGGTLPVTTQTATATPAPSLSPTSGSAPNGIDPTVYATVMQWVNEDGRPPVIAFGQAAVPAEFNGLYDIIVNQWQTGAPATAARTAFWNNLRNEYDPNHKYW